LRHGATPPPSDISAAAGGRTGAARRIRRTGVMAAITARASG